MGSTILVGVAAILGSAPAFAQDALETVTVTGYRASLESAAMAKKDSIGFSDAVFAEDIGKFPDTNIAESLNRIPGITIVRETNGEGVNIAIRGLGTNFTKITLNNAQIAIATTGATDQRNNNREVDLNMFPSELFTQLKVDKSLRADLLEGGAAGNVNMRTQRPFDKPGFHVTYSAQAIDNSMANGYGGNGALVISNTWDGTAAGSFGVLFGVTGKTNYTYINGWEAGNSAYITPTISTASQCYGAGYGFVPAGVTPLCDIGATTAATVSASDPNVHPGSVVTNGNGATNFVTTMPSDVASTLGYTAGQAVDAQVLLGLNPSFGTFNSAGTSAAWTANGTAMTKFGNMIMPRLAREMYQRGTRDRYNAVLSFEWRPTDNLHFYLDTILGRQFNDIDRTDNNWLVRYSSFLPVGVKTDSNNVLTSGRFYETNFFLEARPYKEKGDFFSINPGMTWQVTDLFEIDLQANASRSHFLRDSPTFGVMSTAMSGAYVDYSVDAVSGRGYEKTNIAINTPSAWGWAGGGGNGRAYLQAEKRYTQTTGAHLDLKYGGSKLSVKVGAAWDDISRGIVAIDAGTDWSKLACGGLTTTNCNGAAGSAVLNADIPNYLYKGPDGWVAVNYDSLKAATQYDTIDSIAIASQNSRCQGQSGPWFSTTSNTGGVSGCYEEKVIGLYAQADGVLTIGSRDLNYDIGLRWAETHQSVSSPSATTLSLTSPYTFGGTISSRTYTPYTFPTAKNTYQAFLPSASVVYHIADDFLIRASVSRTMTRPNVSQMIAVTNFSSQDANAATLGNPTLRPFFSNNIDFGMEYYTGGEGYLSLAVFRKNISGFPSNQTTTVNGAYMQSTYGITYANLTNTQQVAIAARQGFLTSASTGDATACAASSSCYATAAVSLTMPINAAGIETIDGMEFGYVQPLDFLLEGYGVKGLGVSANVTLVDQSSSGVAQVHAFGVAPFTYNLTGYYEHDGIMARMSYTFTARAYQADYTNLGSSLCFPTTAATSSNCPSGPFIFSADYGQADFSSSIKVSRLLGSDVVTDPEITFSVQNVFSAKQKSYFTYKSAPYTYYNKGQTFMFGLHGSL